MLPDKYRTMEKEELKKKVADAKKRLGEKLCILGHFYQNDEVIEFADHQGDSFTLAKEGSQTDADWIVFCGVHFMAQASVILAKKGQRVFLPDMDAGCPLSDMADIEDAQAAWEVLEREGCDKEFVPIVYMNSSAELKAFCGRHGGCVCTSSSAAGAFRWAFENNKRVLFFPDENLGRNIAHKLGVDDKDIVTWNPDFEAGGKDAGHFVDAKVIVWNGYCHVHTLFTPGHVEEARAKYPGCKIVVHPECYPEVVRLADEEGSTAFLKRYAERAQSGSTVVIGTEINLVSRLAREIKDKRIVPLARSLCPNMFKVSLADLCWTVEELGNVNEVFVPDAISRDAKLALGRMLKIGAMKIGARSVVFESLL